MKIAAIDFGNTKGKVGLFEKKKLTEHFAGEKKEILKFIKKVNANALVICSVAHSKSQLEELFSDFPQKIILNHNTPIPILNSYGTPNTLGYDRLAAAVGAHAFYPNKNKLIIDLGTAIKYDYIDNKGVFHGGIISPGMQMRFKALHTFTSKLPLVKADGIPKLIGGSTESCIQSGVINGISAELNGIIEKYQKIDNLKILLSGGDAHFFESQINYPTFATPNLILHGLYRILIHNVENKSFTF